MTELSTSARGTSTAKLCELVIVGAPRSYDFPRCSDDSSTSDPVIEFGATSDPVTALAPRSGAFTRPFLMCLERTADFLMSDGPTEIAAHAGTAEQGHEDLRVEKGDGSEGGRHASEVAVHAGLRCSALW